MNHDSVHLVAMSFVGFHGTRPEESTLGQRFVVDIQFWCDLRRAGQTDDLNATVDYSQVHRVAREVVEGPAYRLTEAVAEAIARQVLAEQPLIEQIRVRVTKPWVRLEQTMLEGSAVEIIRTREDYPVLYPNA